MIHLLLAISLAQQFQQDVKVLASDRMEGRGLGTQGIERAADWIESQLRASLKPAFPDHSYRQPFRVKTGVARAEGNRLEGVADDDWTPLGMSSSASFRGQLAFVGYGIAAPPLNYDDFAGIDLKGKVALMLRYEPQERDEKSIFDGKRPSRWSAMRYKVLQARERGAVAVIFVTGPMQDEGKEFLPVLKNDGPQSPAGIPVLQVKTSVAQKWGIDLAQFQKNVDADLKPRSRVIPIDVDGRVSLRNTFAHTANLAGILPGAGPLAREVVILGAHYDHLGYGGEGSMRPNVHAIHNGADDNASGTVAVLLAAQKIAHEFANTKNHRTLVAVLFSAEEAGLGGSSWFVDHPPVPLDHVIAMVNLDMVGTLRDDQLVALGADTAPQWRSALDPAAESAHLKVAARGDGYGPSDQTSFYAKRIPVVHFFTGAHERYHTPDDKWNTLNYAGAARVTEFTADVVERLVRGTVTPTYVRLAAAPALEGDSRGYGAYLGTIPDYRAMEATSGGVLLADVRAGGPADLAGIRGGDRIIQMAGTHIENLYDMTFALQDHKPGETIDVVVVRSGEQKKLRATLGVRGAPPTPAALTIKAGKPFDKTFEGEKHLKNIRQLTFGGENAEAYFSSDGTRLIYQATVPGAACDQEYTLDLRNGETKRVSSGKGRTTCGYFVPPKDDRIIYSSTEAGGADCPPAPDRSHGYVWAVYPTYDIYEANPDGSNAHRITTTAGYDAESTWCAKGGKFVFTSDRDGDLELYEMDDKGNVRRLTNSPGYDGGAFYNADCTEIVFRGFHPTGAALDEYRSLLANHLVKPTVMELFVMNADGSNVRQLTQTGAANFCPFFTPDGKKIIYSSNVGDPKGREFDLWLISKTGGSPERITTAPGFDGFPMFSPDGKLMVWASNRADPASHETNLFIAEWVE
ncbi:MAG TPA: M28 family peptidase [Thermoanaerobaculia bacterium]|nr:M28 family peptidase [Thermoanaerobaculia bacterium]